MQAGSAPRPRNLARGGALSFVGAAASAVLGFLITVVLARTLGEGGTGVVLQAIAIFMIALSFGRAGMDSTAVWLLPRLATSDPRQVRGALMMMMVVAVVCSAVVAGICLLLTGTLSPGSSNLREVGGAMNAIAWFLPVAAVVLVMLNATRALGGVLPYVSIGGVGLPAVRLAVVAIVATTGGSLAAVAAGWAAPLPAALIAVGIVLAVQLSRHEHGLTSRSWWPPSGTRRLVRRYSTPRVISAGLEQAILWLDVLIVGALLGSAAAGVYGGASRFIAAGLIVDTAIRVVVSPRFSVLLGLDRIQDAENLYRTAARWLVLFSAPIYLMLAIHAPVVLGWLGPGFVEGATALAILSAGAIITFMAGNIHSVLLMSGRSGLAAVNKLVVLVVNVAGNLLLVPMIGIVGAAVSWAASMLIDAALAAIEVRRLVGVRIDLASICYATAIPLVSIGLPAVIIRLVWGSTGPTLLLSIGVGAVLFAAWCLADARRLHLREAVSMLRNGTSAGGEPDAEIVPQKG